MTISSLSSSVRARLATSPRLQAFLQKISLRSYIIGLVTSLFLGGGYLAFAQGSGSQVAAQTYVGVEKRTIVTGVKAVGKVTFASEQQLKFNQKGTVAKVNFKEGDAVKQGQVIAELDKVSASADVRSARLGIGASQLQLQQLEADREKQVLSAQNAVASASRQVVQSMQDLTKTRETELQSLASTAQDTLVSGEKLLDSYYSTLTRDSSARPPNYDTTFEINRLLYRDWMVKEQVDLSYRDAVNQAETMHGKYGTSLNSERNPQVILQALNDAQSLAKTLQNLGEQAYSLMQGASTDSITFTVDDLNTLRGTINTDRATAAGLVNDVLTAKANLAALTEKGNSIPSVTLQVKENTVASNEEDRKVKEATLKSTLADLDIAIQLKQNDIAQKSASLTKLNKTLDDYRLVAPFDGVITHLDYKVGDNLLDTGDTESLTLQNLDFLLITIPLDQVDVVRIRKDMPASIVFDAVPGQTFQGVIDKIDSTAITTSGVVSYNVSIRMPTPAGLNILSGMTATVQIETARKEGVLAVPNLALRTQKGSTSVQKSTGETVQVTTGITDGRYTEIVSGLSEGDSILSVNLGTSNSSSSANAQQVMRGLGGLTGGGGPPGR
ncbi:MAG: efflux RND transporter periplasmic adaptor subunit [Candidatus Peribacteraceae bacterium]|nr:efflux RND transporter periplasmic adaptor subunit [Candidatus Peribacteraceae bacterium]MDD5074405.1 efflux RND transporter periplasmic adaptor subunit [Candidatus Peribacteraceae bacterium]